MLHSTEGPNTRMLRKVLFCSDASTVSQASRHLRRIADPKCHAADKMAGCVVLLTLAPSSVQDLNPQQYHLT